MLWRYFCHHLDVAIRDPGLLDSSLGERLVNAYYVSYFRRWCAISIWLKLQSFHSNNCGKMFCNTIYKNIHFILSDNLHQLYHQFTLSILTEMMHSIATLTVNGMVKRQRHWVYCEMDGGGDSVQEEGRTGLVVVSIRSTSSPTCRWGGIEDHAIWGHAKIWISCEVNDMQ